MALSKQCSADCSKPARTRNLCNTHYMQAYRSHKLKQHQPMKRMLSDSCAVKQCETPRIKGRHGSRYCTYHKDRASSRYLRSVLDKKTGLFKDEDPSVLNFRGKGLIICGTCNRATSKHGPGEFCYAIKAQAIRKAYFGLH